MPGYDPKQEELDRINAELLGKPFYATRAAGTEKAVDDAVKVKHLEERLQNIDRSRLPVPEGLEKLREMLATEKGVPVDIMFPPVAVPPKIEVIDVQRGEDPDTIVANLAVTPAPRTVFSFAGVDFAESPDEAVITVGEVRDGGALEVLDIFKVGDAPELDEAGYRNLRELLAKELTSRNLWMGGMRYAWMSGDYGTYERVKELDDGSVHAYGPCLVDTSDDATVGCLLELLSKVWPFYGICGTTGPHGRGYTRVTRYAGMDVARDVPNISYLSERRGDAVMRALLSGWGVVS